LNLRPWVILNSEETIEHIIRPGGPLALPNARELIEYRDLFWLMVRRDLVARYQQTIMGPLWFVLQPVLTALIFAVIFGRVAHVPIEGHSPFLFYLAGLAAWGYFAQNLNASATSFTANAHLFGKVYFPRLIVPLSAVISNLAAWVIQIVTFFVFLAWDIGFAGGDASGFVVARLLFLPFLALYIALLSLGICLWLSSLTAKYRDLAQVVSFLIQIWLYATPVIYPIAQVSVRWRWLWSLNPMTAVVETHRWILLGSGTVSWADWLPSLATTVLLLLTGMIIFEKVQRRFVDTV
jgi:lipopolysaccharide transport system permease protein